ncbi:uncharacterized protein SOCE26_068040 [Sorangium cellulosum]|uniref:Serpin domain-containing protein n=1 Tax=Sorangium cellulosum TaxID=56 RepID=A0A2L0F163_SORCE|nr:hypothetical protein [Sorangium cellulosum]AUX45322.1 uncharacterized protein SOCE26_068040 [Sorangium cellulosum]
MTSRGSLSEYVATSEQSPGRPIVPTLHVDHAPDRDLVWCASLELAWRQLCAFIGGPLILREPAQEDGAAALVRALNESPVAPEEVDPASCVAVGGLRTAEWLRQVESLLEQRFGGAGDARLLSREPEPDLLGAYAYMAKTWRFRCPFQRLHGWMRFRGVDVDSFSLGDPFAPGDTYSRLARQVIVHHHRFIPDEEYGREPEAHEPSEEFVVELVTEDPADCLVVARATPRRTLAGTVAWAVSHLREDAAADPRAFLTREEKFEIPCIDFDRVRRYDELHGTRIANPGFEAQALGEVLERVRFRLDEGGATLVSEAEFRGLSLPPRTIVCNGPFLVMVLRRGAPRPFLAIWIETPDLLVR